jgi:4-phospho-D-threonate 3-dehydrogenase / 4-phospho-D-erythronate 3-dehydrogenase
MSRPLIGVTCGDPAGIGPELMLRLLVEPSVLERCVPVVFADGALLARVAAECALPLPRHVVPRMGWRGTPRSDVPMVVDCAAIDADDVRPGQVAAACGLAAYVYIEECTGAVLRGQLDGMATGPIHKEAIHLAGVPFPGHTEILAALTGAPSSCMMLTSDRLSVSFVTTHVGYAEVPRLLTVERIVEVIDLSAEASRALRGHEPRLLVCGLNPHAGEHGLFGDGEEERVIAPAVAAARELGLQVEGPISPDAAFLPSRMAKVDCIVCMYHDQGHIPFKHVAWDTGVNLTLGLPIVRASVDHGTAFDIAWKGIADSSSLNHVMAVAARLAVGRRRQPVGLA